MQSPPHRATPADLDALWRLEAACFEPGRREARRVLRASLKNPRHEVWVLKSATSADGVSAAVFLRLYAKALRLHSIAVDPTVQGEGLGAALFHFALERGRKLGRTTAILESDCALPHLAAWYQRHGFRPVREIADYYGSNRSALRMRCSLQ